MDLFVSPEKKLHQESGRIEKQFNLFPAQIIFPPDERKPEV